MSSSDFKRIKAKVGKRAPVKANVTDTKFTKSTLHLSQQNGITTTTTTTTDTTSTHKKSSSSHPVPPAQLPAQWQRQLQHPTVSIRTAILQSIRQYLRQIAAAAASSSSRRNTNNNSNLITTKGDVDHQQQFQSIMAPTLLLALAPVVCTDEDDTVRSNATKTLQELVSTVTTSTITTTASSSSSSWLIPFVPYMTALIATSLNSLSIRQCWDGAILVQWFVQQLVVSSRLSSSSSSDETPKSNSNPNSSSNNNNNNDDMRMIWFTCLQQFIPPLTRLLSDRTSGDFRLSNSAGGSGMSTKTTTTTGASLKKQKRRRQQQHSKGIVVEASAAGTVSTVAPAPTRTIKKNKSTTASESTTTTTTARSNSPKQCVVAAIHALFHAATTSTNGDSTSTTAAVVSLRSLMTRIDHERIVVRSTTHRNATSNGGGGGPMAIISTRYGSHERQPAPPIYSLVDGLFPSYMRHLGIQVVSDDDDTDMDIGNVSNDPTLCRHGALVGAGSNLDAVEQPPCTLETILDLLGKLRDCAIEATMQYKQHPHQSPQYMLQCFTTIRFVLESNFVTPLLQQTKDNEVKRLEKLCVQVASCLLESFPIIHPHNNNSSNDDDANALFCQTLLCLSVTIQCSHHSTAPSIQSQLQSWIQTVALHVQSAFEDDEAAAAAAGDNTTTITTTTTSAVPPSQQPAASSVVATSKSLLVVFCQLLQLLKRKDDPLLGNASGRQTHGDDLVLRGGLLDLFCAVFFPTESTISASVAVNETGRFAAQIGCQMIMEFVNRADNNMSSHTAVRTASSGAACRPPSEHTFLADIIDGLPVYLRHWGAQYPNLSSLCLTTLLAVVRRYHCATNASTVNQSGQHHRDLSHLCALLQPLLTASPSNHSMTMVDIEVLSSVDISVFEQYPEELQRQVICLFTMLSIPSATTVKALANICARSRLTSGTPAINPSTASFIVQCVHNVRKTMAMPIYIRFLIDSTGVMSLDATNESEYNDSPTLARQIDLGVRDVAYCLVDCGTAKVLPMLQTLLTALLQKGKNEKMHPSRHIHVRAALSLLAMFSGDLQRYETPTVCAFDYVSDKFQATVCDCITEMICTELPASPSDVTTAVDQWLRPVLSLFESEKGLMKRVFATTLTSIDQLPASSQSSILEIWLAVIRSSLFDLPPRLDCYGMMDMVNSLQSTSGTDGPKGQILSSLLIALELKSKSATLEL